MKKIPTLFKRDPDDMRHVLPEVTPGCEWVVEGEGVATRKYDGTCVMLDPRGLWWARREVRPDKQPPDGWVEVDRDDTTGKRVGWEPLSQSGFFKFVNEALSNGYLGYLSVPQSFDGAPPPGTYELLGPKVNGNPEGVNGHHVLVMHGYTAAVDEVPLRESPRTFDALGPWLSQRNWEGVVWHHPDGRMAKLKKRDFA